MTMAMTWALAVVFYVVLMVTDKPVAGKAGTSLDCMETGIEGQRTGIQCTIHGTLRRGILWFRPGPVLVAGCNTLNTVCITEFKFLGKYTSVIDSPSQQTLVIESFDRNVDAGEWMCTDGPFPIEEVQAQPSCRKTKLSTTSLDCMEPGIEGHTTRIQCSINGTLRRGIQWFRPGTVLVAGCNTLNTACTTRFKFLGKYTSVIDSPSQQTLVIESFDRKVDAGEWICNDGSFPIEEVQAQPSCRKTVAMLARAKSGACAHVASTSMVIFWTIAILAPNL
ncbi:uncharacterized protein LOC121386429 [Gigantopelta aegis]|uniref:uncharacterized protein LOC121386429 n=1 Tax=Gigantopelta aegis TaxID=1735272 RepID=UPI001B888A8C|nr:uncharacterized protein LOC121386429 [Gigantopelta aegis]XP_041373255.1 uncharacterized protein LOC121386429 [Gigantopelta aegis]